MSDVAQDSSRQDYVHELLEKYSTDKYYILCKGPLDESVLSNHVSQVIITLDALGASKSYINERLQELTCEMELAEHFKDDEVDRLTASNVHTFVGKRKGFYRLKDYYNEVTRDSNDAVTDIIGKYLPPLCRGMIGTALHGLIHLGYGKYINSRPLVIEGLAYLHFINMPLETGKDLKRNPGFGRGTSSFFDVLTKVKNTRLQSFVLRKIEQAPWDTFCPPFQKKAAVLFTCKANDLLDLVYLIKLPEKLVRNTSEDVSERSKYLGKWLVDTALVLYTVAAKRNDFFIMHCVSSAFALSHLLPCLRNHDDMEEVVTIYLCALLAVYVCQDCPDLDFSHLNNEVAVKTSWEEIIKRTLYPPKDDEHIYKLVQVCHDMSRNDDNPLYKVAALVALDFDFVPLF